MARLAFQKVDCAATATNREQLAGRTFLDIKRKHTNCIFRLSVEIYCAVNQRTDRLCPVAEMLQTFVDISVRPYAN